MQATMAIPQEEKNDVDHTANAMISVGRVDTTYEGDKEILSILTGGGDDE